MAEKTELTDILAHGVDLKSRRIYFGVNLDSGGESFSEFTMASVELAIRAIHRMTLDAPGKPIEIHMNSEGGDVYAAFRLHDEILACPCQVKFVGGGVVMSSASIIMSVCDERWLHPTTTVLVHEGSEESVAATSTTHTSAQIEAAESRRVLEIMYNIYAANSRMTKEFWEDVCQRDVYMSAGEAVSLGLADKIIEPKKRGNLRKMRQHGLKKEVDAKQFRKMVASIYQRIGRKNVPKLELNEPVKEPADPNVVIVVDPPVVAEPIPTVPEVPKE